MIKDWSEAPEWAMWRAKDSSGEVWYYENKPAKHPKVQIWVALDGQQVLREEKIEVGERVRDVRQAADGTIYIVTDSRNGKLLKLLP